MKTLLHCLILSAVLLNLGMALAGDDFGVPAYPGGKSDADTQAFCSQPEIGLVKDRAEKAGLITTKHCYRTSDALAKVADFYSKQKGATGGISVDVDVAKSASYCMTGAGTCSESSAGTAVAVTAPWFVQKTMKSNNDLLIVITNRAKK